MKNEELIIENEGGKIIGILHKSEKPTDKIVILVHGFTGDIDGPAGFWKPMAEKLCENGFDVYRFSFRFTTKDWSLFQNMTISGEVSDLKKIISVMDKKYKKIGILGESLGGPISILSYTNKIDVMVLWYPVLFINQTPLMKKFLSMEKELEKKGYITHKKFIGEAKVGKGSLDEIRKLDLIPFVKKIKCPIMLIHGDKDVHVPKYHSEKMMEFLKGPKKLEIMEGANHCWRGVDYKLPVPEFQEKASRFTVDWFKRWLK
jgi:esterase/lipase